MSDKMIREDLINLDRNFMGMRMYGPEMEGYDFKWLKSLVCQWKGDHDWEHIWLVDDDLSSAQRCRRCRIMRAVYGLARMKKLPTCECFGWAK